METTKNSGKFENPFLEQWLKTTRAYLFAHRPASSTDDGAAKESPAPAPESHTAQAQCISRVRGHLLRLAVRRPVDDQDPLRELQRIFHSLISFVARNPEVPSRMLQWSAQGGHGRIQRRIQVVIEQFTSQISSIIGRAQDQARIRHDLEPLTAAMLFVGIAQSLVLRMLAGVLRREHLRDEADRLFVLYLAGMRSPGSACHAPHLCAGSAGV